MSIQLSILTDNRSRAPRFKCEHGLSVFLSTGATRLLLDTGQTGKCVENARTLGIDLSRLDAVVLSHGHYDHCGGLAAVLAENARTRVVVHRDALRPKFSLSSVMLKPNGFPQPELLKEANVTEVSSVLRLSPEVTVFALPEPAPSNSVLVQKEGDSLVPDPFTDEIFTLVQSEGKTVLYGGCTHHGLDALLGFVRDVLGVENLSLFVGGLHLSGKNDEEVARTADIASRYSVDRWVINHCSGEKALALWQQRFGASPTDGFAGSQIVVE